MATACVKIIVYPDVSQTAYHRVVSKFEFPGHKKFKKRVEAEVNGLMDEMLALMEKSR